MTTGSDDLGNGAAKTEDRFAGQLGYRPRTSRDNGTPLADGPTDELGPRNGVPGIDRISTPLDIANPIASTLTQPKLSEPELPELSELREPAFRENGFRDGGYAESTFTPEALLDAPGGLDTASGKVADHPLLRGLLLELPPKGSTLHAQWLDRWVEAARSILDLLYRFED